MFFVVCNFFSPALYAAAPELRVVVENSEVNHPSQREDFVWKTDFFLRHEEVLLEGSLKNEKILVQLAEKSMTEKDYADLLQVFELRHLPLILNGVGQRHQFSDGTPYETRFFVRGLALIYYYEQAKKIESGPFWQIFVNFARLTNAGEPVKSTFQMGFGSDVMPFLLDDLLSRKHFNSGEFTFVLKGFSALNYWVWQEFSTYLYSKRPSEFSPALLLSHFFGASRVSADDIMDFSNQIFMNFRSEGSSVRVSGNDSEFVGLGYLGWKLQFLSVLKKLFYDRGEVDLSFQVGELTEKIIDEHKFAVGTYGFGWLRAFVKDQYAKTRVFALDNGTEFIIRKYQNPYLNTNMLIIESTSVKAEQSWAEVKAQLSQVEALLRNRNFKDIELRTKMVNVNEVIPLGSLKCSDVFQL
ncbi:MAG: hypothetical protein KDD50_01520 [Bdellovibrionales bacterium]|nr:hypothetical protein [Bdellovibrionales bacterium]